MRRAGQTGGGEESLEGGEAGEGVWLQAEDVDLAGDLAPDQLTGGVVPQVQLRGQDEEVHWQSRPGVVVLWGGMVQCHFKYLRTADSKAQACLGNRVFLPEVSTIIIPNGRVSTSSLKKKL